MLAAPALAALAWSIAALALAEPLVDGAGVPAPARALAARARAVDALPLEGDAERGRTRLRVDLVRQRLSALEALAQSAAPLLRGSDALPRLYAHALLARSQEAFATALGKAATPGEARGSAREAWHEQVEAAVARALTRAGAHWRSCRDLARAVGAGSELAEVCARHLAALPEALGGRDLETADGDAAAVARSRSRELRPCFEAHAVGRERAPAVELTARLTLDSKGRVEAVALAPAPNDPALSECLRGGLWLWVFPGAADAEIEVPLRLWGR